MSLCNTRQGQQRSNSEARMSNHDAWQLEHNAALAYEKDFVPAIFAHWAPVLAEIAGIKPGDRVLDVACGTGVLAREAATRAGPTGRVTGLDLNEGMLAVAQRLRPQIDWRQGDATKLPFDDSCFDAVVSQFGLMFFPDRVAALREMWRVLAPRGRLAVAVCAPIVHSEGYTVFAGILRRNAGNGAAAMVESYFASGDAAQLQELCKAAGIAGVNIMTREGWARFASIDDLLRIEIKGSPLANLIDETSYQKVLKAARQELRDFCDAQGRVCIRLNATIVAAGRR
jgi:ubiquinone/menaquinone biosynthesis C-methylase UbiE